MNIAVILGSGKGERMGITECPKQFIEVEGKPIIQYSIEAYNNCKMIDKIIVVTNSDWIGYIKQLCVNNSIKKLDVLLSGGGSRNASANEALKYIIEQYNKDDIICFHDAVRPLISPNTICKTIESMKEAYMAVTVVEIYDSLIHIKSDQISKVNRKEFYRAMCPEVYRLTNLMDYYPVEDTSALLKQTHVLMDIAIENNEKISIIRGDEVNFKVTTAEDIDLLTAYIRLNKKE